MICTPYARVLSEPCDFRGNFFVFDNQMLAQIIYAGFDIGEITCPTKYFPEASSINFRRSAKYGLGVLCTALQYRMQKWHLGRFDVFS